MSNDKAVIDLLKAQLADAEAGKISSIVVVRVDHNGGLSYSIQAPQAIPVGLIGAMEWAKGDFLRRSALKQEQQAAEQQEAEASK